MSKIHHCHHVVSFSSKNNDMLLKTPDKLFFLLNQTPSLILSLNLMYLPACLISLLLCSLKSVSVISLTCDFSQDVSLLLLKPQLPKTIFTRSHLKPVLLESWPSLAKLWGWFIPSQSQTFLNDNHLSEKLLSSFFMTALLSSIQYITTK